MEIFKILVVLQMVVLCQATLYIEQSSMPCTWAVTSAGENQSLVTFTDQFLYNLADQVCKDLGCGEVYKIKRSTAHGNSSCLSDCIYHNNELNNCSKTTGENCSIVSEVVCDTPYIIPTASPCVWGLSTLKAKSGVIINEESLARLSDDICRSFACGVAFSQRKSTAPPNSTCFTDCNYRDSHFWNCSSVVRNNCLVLSQVTCGNHAVRLTGAGHHCAGRVELWQAGEWGTVCDDQWDKQDADVICAQLGCGYAISVTGQGDPYSQGKGPIIMDELNCTGKERSLWECPAVREAHDCGHKEDAGVVCSEYKDLRLTGGLDRCSGRAEIHRNGSWGTVCDTCWGKEEASMACAMLGCGDVGIVINKRFTHKNGTLWYYHCNKNDKTLWDCMEIDGTNLFLCQNTEAAGVICNNSLGLPIPTSPKPATTMLTTQMTIVAPTFWSLELLGCVLLSCALLIAIIVNIVLCCLAKKRRAVHTVQQEYNNLRTSIQAEENHYRDSVHLVKLTSNDSDPDVQVMAPPMWTQSSVESSSYDTDYDQNEKNHDSSFPLSTFRNSTRYSEDGRMPGMKSNNLQLVMEEDQGFSHNAAMQGHHDYTPNGAFQGITAAPSVDSFDTSSTSSEECYENTGQHVADRNLENYENAREIGHDLQTGIPTFNDTESFLNPTDDHCPYVSNSIMYNQNQDMSTEQDDGDDFPIYSPVSAEAGTYSSEDDYDDIANYAQSKLL